MGYGQPPDKGQLSSYLASSQKHCPQVDRSNRRSRVVKTGFDGWDSRQSFSQLPPVRCAPRMDGDFLRTLNAKNGRRSWVIATAKAMKGPKRGGGMRPLLGTNLEARFGPHISTRVIFCARFTGANRLPRGFNLQWWLNAGCLRFDDFANLGACFRLVGYHRAIWTCAYHLYAR
jgi:hypothetical protein